MMKAPLPTGRYVGAQRLYHVGVDAGPNLYRLAWINNLILAILATFNSPVTSTPPITYLPLVFRALKSKGIQYMGDQYFKLLIIGSNTLLRMEV
ncbi:MAG: hypothetical protein IPK46_18225 [Saprospiraceae bacterium]|nr:hypothetical protein [Saprospiraceae bacterium]